MRLLRQVITLAVASVLVAGCPILPLADYLQTDRKAQFEAWANGLVGSLHGAKYKNAVTGGYDVGYGTFIETRRFDATHDEHIYRQKVDCRFGLVVNKESNTIDAWRYDGNPEACWAYMGGHA